MFELMIFLGLGLIIGSFLNVVLFRSERDLSFISGRSICLSCEQTIAWYDNIPLVSYLILRGKCRHCQVHISWQYPLVELSTGLLFALTGYVFFDPLSNQAILQTLWGLALLVFLTLIVVSDLRSMEIPLIYLIGVNAITAVYLLIQYFFFETQANFLHTGLANSLIGGGLTWSFFFALVYFSHETWMGWGDVWLGLLGGLVVGFSHVLPMLTLSFAVGALYGIGLMLIKWRNLKTQVPFAPFLAFGILATLFLAELYPSLFWGVGSF
jgi:prepilin signal peptidase PulO-like enzyme (type II secretory pathway)